MKKSLSVILSLVMIITTLCALPFSAFAEEFCVWVGGVQVTSDNASDILGDGTAVYDSATKTLTLIGADIQTGIDAFGGKVGIYTTEDLTVIGYGTIGGGDIRYGIFEYGSNNLTLNGDFTITGTKQGVYKYDGGNLFIKGGNINTTGEVTGIGMSDGNITINGGNVTATGNGATNAYGYGVTANTLTVNGGSLTAYGGTSGNYGQGISFDSLNIYGGRVTAIGNNGALYSSPTLGSYVTAFGSYTMSSFGAVPYDANENGNYKWFQSTYSESFDFYAVGDCFSWGFTPGNADGGLRNNGDGTYSRTFTATKAVSKAMLKVTDGAEQWYGDDFGRNYTFTITGAGEFTVTYYSATHKVSVSGSIVAEYVLPVSTVTALGAGANNFLNDKVWAFSDDNKLSEVSPGVWEISYDNVGAGSYEFKFALDGSWSANFGPESSTAVISGVAQNAKYNASDNIAFNVGSDNASVKLQLDLSNYSYLTDSGAKFTVTVTEPVHVHSYLDAVTPPTCTKKGYTTHTCTCGDSYVDTYVDALGHDFGKNEKVCKRCKVANPNYVSPEDLALPTEKKTEEVIKKTNTDKKDISGSTFKTLKPKATAKKQTITLTWKKVKGADGYIIYGARCGKDMKKLKTIKNPKTVKHTFKKLKKGKYYKYIIVAYKTTADGKKRVVSKSKSVHCTTDGGKKGNPNKIVLKKSKLLIKKGKTVQISGKVASKPKMEAHIAVARFESSNTKIATVDKNGKVKGKKKGTVTIYVIAQNGIYKTVKIKVK